MSCVSSPVFIFSDCDTTVHKVPEGRPKEESKELEILWLKKLGKKQNNRKAMVPVFANEVELQVMRADNCPFELKPKASNDKSTESEFNKFQATFPTASFGFRKT